MLTKGRAIFRSANFRGRFGSGDESPISRALLLANIKRKASNSWSAVQDTYFLTKVSIYLHSVSNIFAVIWILNLEISIFGALGSLCNYPLKVKSNVN